MRAHTPGPWSVRIHERDGEMLDCFVTAPDVNGFAYAAEILGDDEYRSGLERKLADCHLIAAATELLEFAEEVRRNGDTRLANMAIAVIAKATGGKQ